VSGAVGFQQAAIKVERETEFDELKGAIDRTFAPDRVEKFLKDLRRKGVRIRDWVSVLKIRALEQVDEDLKRSGKAAQGLYDSLTVSDQAQMREFYLSRIEVVGPQLRAKFHKLYQYY
jgi:hypothetical protein